MRFVTVEVDVGPAQPTGFSRRFVRANDAPTRAVVWMDYTSPSGLGGRWHLFALHAADEAPEPGVSAVLVEDAGDIVWLLAGGRHGIVLVHEGTHAEERAPYLIASQRCALG